MARWKPMQIVGGSYADDALPWTHQDTVNYLPVPAEKEGVRSSAILRGVPGFTTFCDLGTNAPIRGMRNVEGRLFVVSGSTLFLVKPDGSHTSLGTIPGVSRCSLSHNQITGGNEVVISNGQAGYIYNTAANTFAQITDEAFIGAISFDFVDGYILGIEPARRFAFTSDLADAGSYSSLDRYEAEGSPDLLVGQAVTHREWWLMGERTIEPFTNTGDAEGTFQRTQGTVIEVGLAATHAVAVMDNSVFWLGSDGIVYRANGYTPQRISTHAIEQAISRCTLAKAFAFTWEDAGHKVFYLTFQDGQTWGYDAATGEWHRRESYGLDRWRINALVKWNGKWMAGDYSNGKLYALDKASGLIQHEDGQPLERRRITGVTHDNQNRLIIDGLALVIDTGKEVGNGMAPMSVSGSLVDGFVGQSYSRTFTAFNVFAPVSWDLVSGSLPAGLGLGGNGVVSGIPTEGGAFSVVIRATDSQGRSAQVTCPFNIRVSSDVLSIGGTHFYVNSGLTPSYNLTQTLSFGTNTTSCLAATQDAQTAIVGTGTTPFAYLLNRNADGTYSTVSGGYTPTSGVDNAAFSADGAYLWACGNAHWVSKRQGDGTYSQIATFSASGSCLALAWNHDASLVFAGQTGGSLLYSRSGDTLSAITLPNAPGGGALNGYAVAWRAGANVAAVASSFNLCVLSVTGTTATLSSSVTLPSGSGTMHALQWSPDGQYLYAYAEPVSGAGSVAHLYVYKWVSGTLVLQASPPQPTGNYQQRDGLSLTQTGNVLIAATSDGLHAYGVDGATLTAMSPGSLPTTARGVRFTKGTEFL